ncbi:MAG: hypothetical protein ACI93S_000399 [Ancylomarina sp.]|jgi:hypothetical protein
MKNILYIASFLALVFTSCDPMEDTYDELDGLREPYKQDVEFTLADADYATLGDLALAVAKTDDEKDDAKDIAKYKSFSKYLPAANYIPLFLKSQYATLELNSSAKVTYKYYQGSLYYLRDYASYIDGIAEMDDYYLQPADYDSMGEPGSHDNFSYNAKAEDYLPAFLLGKYIDAVEGDEQAITYKYYDSGSTTTITEVWIFDGSVWAEKDAPELPEGVTLYELIDDDYDSMGAPGSHDNFSSSDDPAVYLPKFMNIKFAYATEGDKIATQYRFYKGKIDGKHVTVTELREFTFDGTQWDEYESTVDVTGQYMNTKDGWVFDPTTIFTMVSSDYQMIVDYSIAEHGKTSDYPDSEYYYGSSGAFSNFDLRLKNRNTEKYPMPEFAALSTEDAVALTMERMKEGVAALLTVKYPNAVTQVSGIDVFYFVDVKAYKEDLTDGFYTLKFQCTKSGPSPEFTYIEGL